jgi:hypothetical protein
LQEQLNITYFESVPWFMRVYFHTLQISINGSMFVREREREREGREGERRERGGEGERERVERGEGEGERDLNIPRNTRRDVPPMRAHPPCGATRSSFYAGTLLKYPPSPSLLLLFFSLPSVYLSSSFAHASPAELRAPILY